MFDRLQVRNFKSLRHVDLRLSSLAVFVGENGAGKSNLLDAVRFVADALDVGLDHAVRTRGGVDAVRRKTSGHPTHFEIALDVRTHAVQGRFQFKVGARPGKDHVVTEERAEAHLMGAIDDFGSVQRYHVRSGVVEVAPAASLARADPRELHLRNVTAIPAFAALADALKATSILHPAPSVLKELALPDARRWLASDGANLPSIVKALAAEDPAALERVVAYLGAVVPGVTGVRHVSAASRETLEFKLEMDNRQAWPYYASAMSDGTLRATALLTALFQPGLEVVGIEEPEISLHPKATHALADAITEASAARQIMVTTHSPEFIGHDAIGPRSVFLVGMHRGVSDVVELPSSLRSIVEDGVFTLPELQRLGQLVPDDGPPQAVAQRIRW